MTRCRYKFAAKLPIFGSYLKGDTALRRRRSGRHEMGNENHLFNPLEIPECTNATRRVIMYSNGLNSGAPKAVRTSGLDLTVVVPCYNEEQRLNSAAFLEFLQRHPFVRVIFVNDGSKDCTINVLNALRAKLPDQVLVIDLQLNNGKAEAVRQGLLFATRRNDALIAYWDADLATPLDCLTDFASIAARFTDVHVVFGSRRRMLGHRIQRSVGRRAISRTCGMLARLALRLPIADTQCGAKLLRNSDALRAAIAAPFTASWLFDVELFARIAYRIADYRLAFYEMPLSEWTEVPGSKVSARAVFSSGLQMLGLIARIRLGCGHRTTSLGQHRRGDSVTSAEAPRPALPLETHLTEAA